MKGGPHECSDFKMEFDNKHLKKKGMAHMEEKGVNKTSDITGNVIYDNKWDRAHVVKPRNVKM